MVARPPTSDGLWVEAAGALSPATLTNNVGIGTTSPVERLVVKGSAPAGYVAQFTDSSESNNAKIYVDSNGIGFVKDSFDDGIEFASDTARIYVNGSQRLRIDSSGNTLIGGTLPAAPNISLNADGSAEFDGDVLIGSGKNVNAGTNGAHVKLRDLNGIVVTTNNQPNFRGYNFGSGTPTSQINADGSATFAGGNVELRNFDDDYGTVAIRNTGGNQFYLTYAESDVLGLTARSGAIANQTQPIKFNGADGSATFAGQVNGLFFQSTRDAGGATILTDAFFSAKPTARRRLQGVWL